MKYHIVPMDGSKDNFDVSPNNIIEQTIKTLSVEDHQEFEEHKEQLIKKVQAKFMTNFKVDRNHKVVRQWATDLASLRRATTTPKVSETNEIKSLRSYKDEQREQMQQIIGVCKMITKD